MNSSTGQEAASLTVGETPLIGWGRAARLGCGKWVGVKTQPKTD